MGHQHYSPGQSEASPWVSWKSTVRRPVMVICQVHFAGTPSEGTNTLLRHDVFSVEQLSSTVSEAGTNFTSDKRLGQSF
jgi:hypothetical protein